MQLVEEALSFIPDGSTAPIGSIPGAWELAERINASQATTFTETSTAGDLKAAVMALAPNLQAMVMASLLNQATPGQLDAKTAPTLADIDAAEDRNLRRWVVKAFTGLVVFCVVVIVTVVAVIGVRTGQIPNTPLVNGIISIAQDVLPVIQLIFAPSS